MSADWCTIESDPGVFTELVASVGVKDVMFQEVFSLDDDSLAMVPDTAHGLVFLFQWQPDSAKKDTRAVTDPSQLPSSLWFAEQTVHNACATQAILSVLFNAQGVTLGDALTEFKTFALELPAEMRGDAIGESETLRAAHNSFTLPDQFATLLNKQKRAATEDDEVYHFVAYVPVNGRVYELDGLKKGPIDVGSAGDGAGAWRSVARDAIQQRIALFSQSADINYALMAVVEDPTARLTAEIAAAKANGAGAGAGAGSVDSLEADLAEVTSQHAAWRAENVRRRHDYTPFVLELCKALASAGKLTELAQASLEATRKREEAAEARKKAKAAEAAAAKTAEASK